MTEFKLNIGARVISEGWKNLDIDPGPGVDYVGDCCDLSQFGANTADVIYASHVLEHVSYIKQLPTALNEWFRVLKPGGLVMISVPDFEAMCQLFVLPGLNFQVRFHIMRIIFGGQMDKNDFHTVGLTFEFMESYLKTAGFQDIQRVESLGIFKDTSTAMLGSVPISLNVTARKPAA